MSEFPDHAQLANLGLIEELYRLYSADPTSVSASWRHFFEGIDFGSYLYKRGDEPVEDRSGVRIQELIEAYRRYGHIQANFNPLDPVEGEAEELELEKLGFFDSELDQEFPTLGFCGKEKAPLKEIIAALEEIYCSRIGFETVDLGNRELEKWIQQQIEPRLHIELSAEEKHRLLEMLTKSEVFETFLHTKYAGQTRFSLEGAETMIPIIAALIDRSGAEKFVIGMAHRGRLNVLTNILNKPLDTVFQEFEDDLTLGYEGNDDVKYHMGFTGQVNNVTVTMVANPSHLESVNPVMLGQVFAEQTEKKDIHKTKIVPLQIHGDASLAGQGVVYETLQLMNLPGYTTGGTVHLVVNNQIGYTTLPEEGRSTRYCTDIAKTFGCPVFHVNAEDPESCIFAAKLAIDIRQKFGIDVFIDLLCYRKYGHNEGDEPSYTQPLQYKLIRAKKSIRQMYVEQKLAEELEVQFKETLKKALETAHGKAASQKKEERWNPFEIVPTACEIKPAIEQYCTVPDGFHLHPKLQKWMQERLAAEKIDWSTAECAAFGTLLMQGVGLRLAGEDAQRGTFSQRHMVWIDSETSKPYCPLAHLGHFEVINSPLTEFAGMGFDYGYSTYAANTLVLWEAQYGDFDNGAQVIIDQYIASGEQKWHTPSSLTLLLPHAYEGAGPEHSSARLERFLQLAANNNMQIVNASTPAQYFHLIRRQALRKTKKPLILFTPKSLLRSPANVSPVQAFTSGNFEEILDDPNPPKNCKRLLLCSGKIYYDLLAERKDEDGVVLVRIEQFYPLHREKLQKIIGKYPVKPIWVQEEPENMGAWSFMWLNLKDLTYIGRPASATTATGSHKKHKQEQKQLIELALRGKS